MENNDNITVFQRLIKLLKPDRKEVGQIYGFAILTGLVNLSLPVGVQSIINLIQAGNVSTSWVILTILVILGTAFGGLLQAFQLRINENVQQKIFTRAAFDFAYRVPRLRMDRLWRKYAPELMNRFFDILSVQKGLSKILIDFSTASLQIVFGLTLLSLYHPVFILFSFALVIIILIIFRLTGKRGLETSLKESKYKYAVAHWLQELARTMTTFKLTGYTTLPMEKSDKLVNNYLSFRESHFKVLIMQFLNLVAFKVFVIAGLLIIGGMLVIDQQINLGQFVAAEIIIILIMGSVEKIISSLDTVYDVFTALEKIGQVSDLELENEGGISEAELKDSEGFEITTKNLSFRYPNTGVDALHNVSMHIKKKERICVSGANNSGKSTLLNMIAGIYPADSGTISFNNYPLGNICLPTLRSFLGDCLSHELLFNGTLFENIAMGRRNIGYDQVNWAVEKMKLSDFVKTLNQGYNTMIAPEGKELSRSTVQKIILARSIVDSPKVLLLEDAFEHIERETKREIIDFLTSDDVPWTLITVSNDPHVAEKSDRIFMMHEGQIVQQTTFNELKGTEHFNKIFGHA
jgi:ABC-type bacteriocin/lantibiotic exporter with double-glycine peptidase domain